MKVTDELGLVLEGEYLTVFIPSEKGALVFRVLNRANRGFEVLHYGSLPFKAGEALPTLDGMTATVPSDGVLPARAYNKDGKTFPSIVTGVHEATDMWYLPKDEKNRLFHVIQYVTPRFLRIDVQIPIGVYQNRFQNRVILGVEKDFGFTRGKMEMIHFPSIHYGYRYCNETNANVRTCVRFVYGEYIVEIPKQPELIFDILTRRVQSHWISLPVQTYDESIRAAFMDVYGLEKPFPIMPITERAKAIEEYRKILGGVKI